MVYITPISHNLAKRSGELIDPPYDRVLPGSTFRISETALCTPCSMFMYEIQIEIHNISINELWVKLLLMTHVMRHNWLLGKNV